METKNTISREQLTDLFTEALTAGEAANLGDDGGACNFDAAAIYLPGVATEDVEAAASAANVYAYTAYGKPWTGFWLLGAAWAGQGDRRTRAADAMGKRLEQLGQTVKMYYQID